MRNVDDVVLIVTGCVKPNKNQPLFLNNFEDRLEQYIDSLRFYIDRSVFNKIVFCDNSGCNDHRIKDLETYALNNGKQFEFLSFIGNEERMLRYTNKGIGEAEIMDEVFIKSYLIKDCCGFFKVSGRLKVENINKIVDYTCKDYNYFIKYVYGGLNWLDTRLYYMKCNYYREHVSYCYDRCKDDKLALEEVYYKLVNNYKCLRMYPRISGISGGNGYDYSKMPSIEYALYNVLCFIGLFNLLYPLLYYFRAVINKIK